MPWVKDFDEEEVVKRAMDVFWTKGYEGASLNDLVAAMGINKSSFYNAFQSKGTLFARALRKYDREIRRHMLDQLELLDDPLAAIHVMFESVIEDSSSDPQRKGCLLINTAFEVSQHPPETQSFVRAGLGDIEQFFQRRIEAAQGIGSVSLTVEADETAKWLLHQFVGLRVLGRGALDPASTRAVKALVDQQLSLLLSNLWVVCDRFDCLNR